MAKKTEYLLELLRDLESQANNRSRANKLLGVINREGGAKALIEARQTVGEDPNADRLPGLYAELKSAVDDYNASAQITMPTLEEVVAGVAAADSAES